MGFGAKIKFLRESKKMTQTELANVLGTTLKTISNYETRDIRPRKRDTYEKIATFFDVNINYLLTEEDDFILSAREQYGTSGEKSAKQLIYSMTGLFAGGELPEEDKDALFAAIQEAYWSSKLLNKKHSRLKG